MIHPTAPDLRRAYADGPHGQIHYYDGGGAGAPLLMLHQSPASSSDWFPLIPHLKAAGLRVMAMDTPGMGLSDPFPAAPTIQDYADVVPMVLDHAGVERADLLGHHTGVQIAIEVAVRRPERVRSAALYGVPLMTAEEQQAYRGRIVPRQKDGALHRPVSGGANLTDQFRRLEGIFGVNAAQRMVLSALLAGPQWWHGHNAALDHNLTPALLAAKQPLLLITHAGEMLEANTHAARALRPDAAFVSLPMRGSLAMDEDPVALSDAVIAFLRKVRAQDRG